MTNSADGFLIGGSYGQSSTDNTGYLPVPVLTTNTVAFKNNSATWTLGNYTEDGLNGGAQMTGIYEIAINLAGILDANKGFTFLWATGTCANDVIQYTVAPGAAGVPIPGALLLFGTGLVGLACPSPETWRIASNRDW